MLAPLMEFPLIVQKIIEGENHPVLKDWKENIDLATLHASGVLDL